MTSHHLERVVAAAHSTPSPGTGVAVDPFPTTELQIAVAAAVSNGEPLAVVAAAADVPSLAVLDALDAVRAR